MAVLVIIPDEKLRHRARDLLGPGSLRAALYDDAAFVLAEQNFITDAILWSSSGLDSKVLIAIERLRRMHRNVRVFVITPERVKAGTLGYCEGARVDGYGLESQLGVPPIIERDQTPPTAAGGSSAACH
jgi:hypothetical protein